TTKPVGSGPYKVTSAQPGASVVYERWDGYWDKEAAQAKQITVSYVSDGNARYNGLKTGTYNAAFMSAPQDDQVTQLGQGFNSPRTPVPSPNGLMLNTKSGPFTDPRLRQAALFAIDRRAMSKVTNGIDPAQYQPFPQGFVGYDPSLNKDLYNP